MTKPNKTAGSKSSKDSGPKGSKAIADVAHPGMSAPSDTSKSIITHRPMMRDPMVVEEGEKQTEDEAGLTPGKLGGETKITPLSEQKDDGPAAAVSDAAGTDAAGADAKADDEAEAKTDDKAGDKDDKVGKADPAEKPAEPKDGDNTEEAAKDDDAETGDKPDAEASQSKDKTADDAKAAAQAEEDAKTAKLIESKKYFLPINAVEQRRSTHIAVAGAVLALILAVAWADVALDAGLIAGGNNLPHTHIFNQQTAVPAATASVPTVTYKNFTAPASKLTIRYPSTWQIYDRGSSSTSDNFSPQTEANNTDYSKGVLTVTFLGPVTADTTGSGSFQVKSVNYQKLSHKISGEDVYLRELIYQDKHGKIGIKSSLGNTNLTATGQQLVTLDQNFSEGEAGSSADFVIDVVRTGNGATGFDSVEQARQFMKTSTYKQAAAILLSTTSAKQ